jgi:DNA mismatch repair ATPase MutS
LASLANAAFNHPDWIRPRIESGPFRLEFTAAGNPLLHPRGRVDNDFLLDDRLRLALVTGPNMAGKSTFLKTVGMNLVLAYAGGTVCARAMTVVPRRMAASLKVNDSLDRGLSLFHAELRRLKEILDPAQAGEPVFFLIDEMLKGTNAADRQAGSSALLRQMTRLDTAGLVATHDLQLAGLADEFPGRAANFHFDGRVEGDDLLFDFILRPGFCRSFNALALMRKMGIEV